MVIKHNGITVADEGARNPAMSFTVNGQRASDVARIINASAIRVLNRKQRATTITFVISPEQETILGAQQWVLGALDLLPEEGELEVVCGGYGGPTASVFFPDAVLVSATPCSYLGVSPSVALTYQAGKSSLTPADASAGPDPLGSMRGRIDIPNGADSVAVVFPAVQPDVPIVTGLTVDAPAGTDFRIVPTGTSSLTTAGFLAEVSGPAPAEGLALMWETKPPV